MPFLCRDCDAIVQGPACTRCGSVRIVRHPELLTLAIAHIDCDAFFAAVEKRDRPELRDKPLIIGGGVRGVVSTCCYIARLSGVRSAMPMFKARQLCPQAVVLPPEMGKYAVVSREIRTMFEVLTPLVQPLSIDEAALDLSGTQTLHGAAPAPYRALELVAAARTASRDEAFAAEDDALADLLLSDELRAGLYAFDLVQKRARHPAGAPDKALARPVTKVGVVGAGLMAAQIALLFARRLQVPVVMTDLDQARVDAGVAYVHAEIDKQLARGRLSPDAASRRKALVTGSVAKDGFADANFVIEAVFEELAVKRQVFAEVEAVVPETCVLATNTSSLSVTAMADGLAHPERVVGFHFFNPVAVLPLVEVVRGAATDDAALATALAAGKGLGKNCVIVADRPAFVVNRLLTRFLGEIIRTVDEGTPLEVAEHAPDPLGLPMTPFLLLQLVGPRIALHVAQTLAGAFGDRFAVSPKLRALAESGKSSVYRPDFSVDPEALALLAGGSAPSTGAEVLARALEGLAQEIKIMLDEGVVTAPEDIDLCMILGAGWPFHLGGITPYLDRTGIAAKVNGGPFRG